MRTISLPAEETLSPRPRPRRGWPGRGSLASWAGWSAFYPTEQAIYDHPDMAVYRLAHVARGRGSGCGYHLMLFRR